MGWLFQLREHDLYAGFSPEFEWTKPDTSTCRIHSIPTLNRKGDGYAFFVVKRTWINGKWIRASVSGYFGATAARTVNIVLMRDGSYDRTVQSDFPHDLPLPTKGQGVLQTIFTKTFYGSYGPQTFDVQIDASSGTEEYVTILFAAHDSWEAGYNERFDLHWVEINSESGGNGNIIKEDFDGDITMEQTGTIDDYGFISEGNILSEILVISQDIDGNPLTGIQVIYNDADQFATPHTYDVVTGNTFQLEVIPTVIGDKDWHWQEWWDFNVTNPRDFVSAGDATLSFSMFEYIPPPKEDGGCLYPTYFKTFSVVRFKGKPFIKEVKRIVLKGSFRKKTSSSLRFRGIPTKSLRSIIPFSGNLVNKISLKIEKKGMILSKMSLTRDLKGTSTRRIRIRKDISGILKMKTSLKILLSGKKSFKKLVKTLLGTEER